MVAATVASPGDGSGQITKSPGISRFKNVFSQTKQDLMEETSLTAALDEPNGRTILRDPISSSSSFTFDSIESFSRFNRLFCLFTSLGQNLLM